MNQVTLTFDPTGISYLIGFILPPGIDIINKYVPNGKVRFLVAFLICVAAGFAVAAPKIFYAGGNIVDAFTAIGMVFAEAQVVFNLYYKDSSFRAKLQSNLPEKSTTPVSEPQPVPGENN